MSTLIYSCRLDSRPAMKKALSGGMQSSDYKVMEHLLKYPRGWAELTGTICRPCNGLREAFVQNWAQACHLRWSDPYLTQKLLQVAHRSSLHFEAFIMPWIISTKNTNNNAMIQINILLTVRSSKRHQSRYCMITSLSNDIIFNCTQICIASSFWTDGMQSTLPISVSHLSIASSVSFNQNQLLLLHLISSSWVESWCLFSSICSGKYALYNPISFVPYSFLSLRLISNITTLISLSFYTTSHFDPLNFKTSPRWNRFCDG